MAPQLPPLPEPQAVLGTLTKPLDGGFEALTKMMAGFNSAMTSILTGLQAPFRTASEPPALALIKAPLEAIKKAAGVTTEDAERRVTRQPAAPTVTAPGEFTL